ncbi:MAG: helix-turn-helix transcriptional regulator [Firmicutes bacterium]|nr:helix-turn-helix transcriptional regulator [Bacillota bacterium]MBQ3611946.1 helix-turn-helix transcriptional regulator [Bacillota bacterium]MBR3787075.1 helix-turn-helix transcriptional regulator [Bacillota bacterium]MBR6799400.1 helix-turn-helix transcriptional regulator [Bacillota bacterium]
MAIELKELNKKEMGARVRARRDALGMSREDLAKKLSVTAKTIANIEYGEKGVTLKNLYKLKQVLGVSIDYLMEGDASFIDTEDRRKMLSENILSSLSVCSEKELDRIEKVTRLYVETIVDRE